MSDMKNQNPVIDAAVKAAMGAVTETAKAKDNKLSTPAVRDAKPELVEAMTKAVEADPKVQFSTNTERWFTKRSRWAAIIGIITTIGRPALKSAGVPVDDGTVALIVDASTALGTAWASYLALRAGIATEPLKLRLPYPFNRG